MVFKFRYRSRRSFKFAIGRRDHEGLNALHRMSLRNIERIFSWLCTLLPLFVSVPAARQVILEGLIQ